MLDKSYPLDQIFKTHRDYVQKTLPREAQRLADIFVEALVSTFMDFRRNPLIGNKSTIQLNMSALTLVAVSFWEDILRIESYHSLKHADRHKKAAYIFKWINRLRPVVISNSDPKLLTDAEVHANDYFAIHCAYIFIHATPPAPAEFNNLVYAATYRDNNPQEWSMIFYLLEKLYSQPATV